MTVSHIGCLFFSIDARVLCILECFCFVGMATGTPFTTVSSDTKAPQKLSHSAQQSANGNPSLDGAVKS